MAGSQAGVLDTNQGNESKIAKATTPNEPKTVDPSLQAGAGNVVKEIVKWIWNNRNAIGSFLATLGITNAFDFVKSLIFPKTTEEYNALTPNGRKSIDNLSSAMVEAYNRGDKESFVSAIRASAKVYEQQASMTTDQSMRAKLQLRAKQTNELANGVENGSIPMDSESANRNKSDSKTDEKGVGVKDTTVNTESNASTDAMNKSLGKDLKNILQTVLKLLNVPELNDNNAQLVTQKILALGADPKVAEQILTAYYENVQGLSPEESAAKAQGIVSDAVKANENPQAKENDAAKDDKQQNNQADQGMGGM